MFDGLAISNAKEYEQHRNHYNVIHIPFNDVPKNCCSYEQYINRIEHHLLEDIQKEFPHVVFNEEDALWDVLMRIYVEQPDIRFLFVLDEWDFIFHQDFVTEADQKTYLGFLRSLLKDRPYVCLAYMTGILPIEKYSSGSELNMFVEYTMAKSRIFSEYFGFSDAEVDMLYKRYLDLRQNNCFVTRDELKRWYDGYATPVGIRLYNPRSVVLALSNDSLDNYWTSSGPYNAQCHSCRGYGHYGTFVGISP